MKINNKKSGAFTLIELLTVIAIIGILAAIIIPTVGAVKTSANKAKTRVQFNQWAAGIGLFKQDYGYYPFFSGSTPPTNDANFDLNNSTTRQRFVEILLGKKVDGTALTNSAQGEPLWQNKRKSSYYSFSDNELVITGTTIVDAVKDAFGNIQMVGVIDYDGNGIIDNAALVTNVRAGETAAESASSPNVRPTLPAGGVRAGVIFYSPGKGATNTDVVVSW
jgi:prepilin-type N-terminal cleavage/methylation domain-containing protein